MRTSVRCLFSIVFLLTFTISNGHYRDFSHISISNAFSAETKIPPPQRKCLPSPCKKEDKTSDSIGGSLLGAYKGRAIEEICVSSDQLETINCELMDLVPVESLLTVLPAVDKGWDKGPEARDIYRGLLTVVGKYNGWADQYKVPFNVPDDIIQSGKRWEALRPFILPESVGMGIGKDLGWSDPAGDRNLWRNKKGALAYEMFLLFMWLNDPPDDATDPRISLAWVKREAGEKSDKGRGAMKGRFLQAFHGEYRFKELELPDLSKDTPVRVQNLVHRLGYENPKKSLLDFVRAKDAFLTDLLGLIIASRSKLGKVSPICLNWFKRSASWFPPLTLYAPEKGDESGTVKAIKKRKENIFRHFENGSSSAPDVLPPEIKQSLLQCQVSAITPQRDIVFPDTPWSTWTPKTHSSTLPLSHGNELETDLKKEVEPSPANRVGPARAWNIICQWAAETVGHGWMGEEEDVSIVILPPWRFAFGREELFGALDRTSKTDADQQSAKAGKPILIKVDHVEKDRAVNVQLLQGDQPLVQKRFEIQGPWPPWFASPRFPWTVGMKMLPCLILCVLGIVAALYAVRRSSGWSRLEDIRHLPLICFLAALAMTVFLGIFGPQPSKCGEIGGVVEFDVPGDRTLTDTQKMLITKMSGAVFRVLADNKDMVAVHAATGNWGQRYASFISFPFTSKGSKKEQWQTEGSPTKTRTLLKHFDFRIRPACWGDEIPRIVQGKIAQGNEERFLKEMMRVMKTGGEPDPPLCLLSGRSADAAFSLAFYDGNHGRIEPPSQSPPSDLRTSLVVYMPEPSRDGNPDRKLVSETQWEWTKTRAANAFSLLKSVGTPLEYALPLPGQPDNTARAPSDMDYEIKNWWDRIAAESNAHAIEQAAGEIAEKSFLHFNKDRRPSSKTHLAMPAVVYSFSILGASLCMVMAGLLLAAGRQGIRSRKTLIASISWIAVAILAAIIIWGVWYAIFAGDGFSYSESIMKSVWDAWWWTLAIPATVTLIFRIILWRWNKSPFVGPVSGEYLFEPKPIRKIRKTIVKTLFPMLGLVFMVGACSIWISGLAQAPGRICWWRWLLPIDYPNSLLAGLGLWGVGLFFILVPGFNKDEDTTSNQKGMKRRKDVDIFSGQTG